MKEIRFCNIDEPTAAAFVLVGQKFSGKQL